MLIYQWKAPLYLVGDVRLPAEDRAIPYPMSSSHWKGLALCAVPKMGWTVWAQGWAIAEVHSSMVRLGTTITRLGHTVLIDDVAGDDGRADQWLLASFLPYVSEARNAVTRPVLDDERTLALPRVVARLSGVPATTPEPRWVESMPADIRPDVRIF